MFRNSTVLVCICALVLFWPVALILPRELLFDVINAYGVTLGGAVLWSYWPGVREAARNAPHQMQRGHYLILGIVATWIAMVARTVWLWVWRWMGEPAFGLDHILMAFVAWLIVIGGILHLLSPQVIDGNVPREGWRHLRVAVLLGAVLWLVIIIVRVWSV